MLNERVLAISAHIDDAEFGALGTLLKHKEAGDALSFFAFGEGRSSMDTLLQIGGFFGADVGGVTYADQKYEDYRFTDDFVNVVEGLVEQFKPTIVYCPFIGDLNRDHRIVAEATMVACRPYLRYAPREVLMYEIQGSTNLGLREFNPDRVKKIDVERKLHLLNSWYPNELIHGRETIKDVERFEKWIK